MAPSQIPVAHLTHTSRSIRPITRFLALFLMLLLSLRVASSLFSPVTVLASTLAANNGTVRSAPTNNSQLATRNSQLTTRYFTIYYPEGEEKTATWYAGFADDIDEQVSDLLGSQPISGMTLHIYATEEEYNRAVPMSEFHPGIMAHAIPERKELGVAVERLRNEPPELARESFRHEITHIVAGARSGQNLPIGFQEGLAQYNELSTTRAQEVVQAIQDAQNLGIPLLSWRDLNDSDQFRDHLNLAYPQSYTVMAFLADRYGMGRFGRFVEEMKFTPDFTQALAGIYGMPVELLETEWQQYLPDFLKDGWKQNLLTAYDMGPATALYDAGKFAEASQSFAQSEKLYRDMDRLTQADEAARNKNRADQAQQADDQAKQARQALDGHDYATAQQQANTAAQGFSALALTEQAGRASKVARLAQTGVDALASLQRAHQFSQAFDLPHAQDEARRAGETFALLGDAPRVAEVNSLMSDLGLWQRLVGLGALGAAALSVTAGALFAFRSKRKQAQNAQMKPLREETPSWL